MIKRIVRDIFLLCCVDVLLSSIYAGPLQTDGHAGLFNNEARLALRGGLQKNASIGFSPLV